MRRLDPLAALALVTTSLFTAPLARSAIVTVHSSGGPVQGSAEACFQPLDAAGNAVGASYCRTDSADFSQASGARVEVGPYPNNWGNPVASAFAQVLGSTSGWTLRAGGAFPPFPIPVDCPGGRCLVLSASGSVTAAWAAEFSVAGDGAQIWAEAWTRASMIPFSLVDLGGGPAPSTYFGTLVDGHRYRLSISFGGGGRMSNVPQGTSVAQGWVEFRNATVVVPEPPSGPVYATALALLMLAIRRSRGAGLSVLRRTRRCL